MESAQHKIQESITQMIETLDKENLRKMQARMYDCSKACCENGSYKMEDVQRCIDRCSQPVNNAQQYLQQELGGFQERLQRCAMDCQDKVQDKVTSSTSAADMNKYKTEAEQCMLRCVEAHVAVIPNMSKRIRDALKQLDSAK